MRQLWKHAKNIGRGLWTTLRYLVWPKPRVTILYPKESTPKSVHFRGLHALRRDEHGEERCIACKLCEAVCPARAITIESHQASDGTRRTTRYDIDLFKCIYCGLCEEACPVDAIVETPFNAFHMEERSERILTKPQLLKLGEQHEAAIQERLKSDAS